MSVAVPIQVPSATPATPVYAAAAVISVCMLLYDARCVLLVWCVATVPVAPVTELRRYV